MSAEDTRPATETCPQCKDWRRLVEALEKLLVAYRIGGRPSEKALDDIGRLKRKLGVQ